MAVMLFRIISDALPSITSLHVDFALVRLSRFISLFICFRGK